MARHLRFVRVVLSLKAEGLAHRLDNNPILTSADVAPSQAALEVVSVFNAAAAQVGGETILLLRVGECPRPMTGLLPPTARTLDLTAPQERLEPLPPGTLGEDVIGIAFLDTATNPPRERGLNHFRLGLWVRT